MQKSITLFRGNEFIYTRSFEPNLTSNLIADAIETINLEGKSILDLGCGCGALGLSLTKHNPSLIDFSDISSGAIDDCILNIKNFKTNSKKIELNAIKSNCFDNIHTNKKYDIIINDVSGISEEIAKLSPWFLNAPCESGSDGLFLFKKIIKEAQNYLKPSGILLTPLLSLSNIRNAISFIRSCRNTPEFFIL